MGPLSLWLGVVAVGAPRGPAPAAALDGPDLSSTRILILSWSDVAGDTGDDMLERTLRAELERPEARFYPGVDLYQAGRLEPQAASSLFELRASVPDDTLAHVVEETAVAEAVPWNGLGEDEWGVQAERLLALEQELWFVDRVELREPLFRLYAQIGRAAENSKDAGPPFYEDLGGRTVNLYATLAGAMAADEPALLDSVTDPATKRAVEYASELIGSGRVAPVALSFADGTGTFDPVAFAAEYRVSINGLARTITDPEGLFTAPPGRVDVALERTDGYGLSAERGPTRSTDEVWSVLQEARQRIDHDLRDALAADAGASVPRVDEEPLAWLAIYAALHPTSEIFVAVPDAASGARRAAVWRWDREYGLLARVRREPAPFVVRFAGIATLGASAATVRFRPASDTDPAEYFTEPDGAVDPEEGFTLDGLPLTLEVRGHVGHGFLGAGLSYTLGWTGDEPWADLYPTDGNVVRGPTSDAIALRERSVRRLIYGLTGVAFGPTAAEGFGPRAAVRVGWTNVPHALDVTAHARFARRVGLGARSAATGGQRIQFAIDGGLFGGVILPVHDSLYVNSGTHGQFLAAGGPFPTFGLSAGAGLTF